MKVITEAILRDELRNKEPEIYYIPEGKILSPAGREYLQQRKIKIAPKGAEPKQNEKSVSGSMKQTPEPLKPNYVDFESGAYYIDKPEHMCQLYDNVLVVKNHARIYFRGKLDSIQSQIVLDQAMLAESGAAQNLLKDLDGILSVLQEIMRCDVLNEGFYNDTIIGLSHKELRDQSHNPMKYFKIKQMVLPSYQMGSRYAILNRLRSSIREVEVAAAMAFMENRKCSRTDIIEALNRLSSALHIMMCRYLAGIYK
ncbi:ATP-binding protein [Anaerovorax sp. IOR16]|uniref:ATP-binding protein n=1 Tax=Anaerovorax sp. IOR16 TaxID=2773458 RepID=UPI0019D1F6C1|nr:ATP-binding protein [Anaerovorax sp. IOR16]